jgi:H+/Cl- antiporter ClcA
MLVTLLVGLLAGVSGVTASQRMKRKRVEQPEQARGRDRWLKSPWIWLVIALAVFIAVLQFAVPAPHSSH